jgi:hypothetical protein
MTKPLKFEARKRMPAACAAAALTAAVIAASPAQAQFFFRPFAYTFQQPAPPPAPYASRAGVARILAREGYRLVGPLGSRGDQIVATGVDSQGRRMRFLVDPYEGQVLHARPIGRARFDEAPGEYGAPPPREAQREDGYGVQEPYVVPGVDGESAATAQHPRASLEQRRSAAPRANPEAQRQTAARPEGMENAPPRPAPSGVAPPRAAHHEGGSKRALTPPPAAPKPAGQANVNPAAAPAAPPPQAQTSKAKPESPAISAQPSAPAAPPAAEAPAPAPSSQALSPSPSKQNLPAEDLAQPSAPAAAAPQSATPPIPTQPAQAAAPAPQSSVAQPPAPSSPPASGAEAKPAPVSPSSSEPQSKGG